MIGPFSREIERNNFSTVCVGSGVVGAGSGFLCVEKTKTFGFAIVADCSAPPIGIIPGDANIPARLCRCLDNNRQVDVDRAIPRIREINDGPLTAKLDTSGVVYACCQDGGREAAQTNNFALVGDVGSPPTSLWFFRYAYVGVVARRPGVNTSNGLIIWVIFHDFIWVKELPEKFCGLAIVRLGSLTLGDECPQEAVFSVKAYTRLPDVIVSVPKNTLIFACPVACWSSPLTILGLRDDPKITDAVIQWVVVDMIDNHAGRGRENLAMQKGSSSSLFRSEYISAPVEIPFVLRCPIVAIIIYQCNVAFAVRAVQGDFYSHHRFLPFGEYAKRSTEGRRETFAPPVASHL